MLSSFIGVNYMNGLIAVWQIDVIKENLSYYCETHIDNSKLSSQEKENAK